MSKKISPTMLRMAAQWAQHEVLDPYINECEALLASPQEPLAATRKELYRAELDVLMRLTKVCQRIIEKEPGQ